MKKTNQDKSFLQAINDAIVEEMELDNQVVIIGEDIGTYGGAFGVTRGLLEKFGSSRVIDTPISENSIVGLATGAAITGLKPIVEIMFMDFITLAMDQIVNHMTKLRYMYGGQVTVPVVVRTPAGAGRRYGASHSQSLEAWFMHVPGIKIAVPSNPNDAKHLLKYAIQDENPWLFIEGKKLYYTKGVIEDSIDIPVGKAQIINSGTDCTIVTYSTMTEVCKKCVDQLNNENDISIDLIDLRTLCPLDYTTIYESVNKTGKAVIVEEDNFTGGVGAEISARITENCFDSLRKPILRIASKDIPIPASSALEDFTVPSYDLIVGDVLKYLMDK
tara:strand:+ start:46 stop:1038 length:993 start_codon:yes stop_codon:yes gene_type:complete